MRKGTFSFGLNRRVAYRHLFGKLIRTGRWGANTLVIDNAVIWFIGSAAAIYMNGFLDMRAWCYLLVELKLK